MKEKRKKKPPRSELASRTLTKKKTIKTRRICVHNKHINKERARVA